MILDHGHAGVMVSPYNEGTGGMEGERGTMRRLSIPVVLILLMGLALPAWAKPTASHVVTWTVGGGTITLDTYTNQVVLNVVDSMMVDCGDGTGAMANIVMSGTAGPTEVSIDRQGRSGTFSAASDQLTISIVSGCGDVSANAISASFETDKGKAEERSRIGSDRIIVRSGSGSLFSDVPLIGGADVTVITTISR